MYINRYTNNRPRIFKWVGSLLSVVLLFLITTGGVQAQDYSVEIMPEDTTLHVEEQLQFEAYLLDNSGTRHDTTFSWSSSNELTATVSGTGLVTAVSPGETEITATFGDSSATAELEIEAGDDGDDPELPAVVIQPASKKVSIGDSVHFSAYILKQDSTRQDTTFTWTLSDSTVGQIDSAGTFVAKAEGETKVWASFDSLSGEAEVEVEFEGDRDDDHALTVSPRDTAVAIGNDVQFSATLKDTSGSEVDTTFTWSVKGQSVGTIDSTGLFTATHTGIGLVVAEVGELKASATVIVQDSTSDTTGTQTITIIKPRPNPIAPNDTTVIHEGESYRLSGFPFPLNLLNGGLVHFPHGSLKEDISLKIEMPSFARVTGDSVTFEEKIISAVSFHVMIDDTVASPYYFEQPLIVSIPYKRGLVHNVLGITPDQLGMFFYDPETGMDTTGISGTVVDSSSNRIFASVAHFSNLVLAPNETTTPIPDEGNKEVKPTSLTLDQNYPNPFNPTTTIAYTIPADAKVTLEVYNLLGKRVATLVNGRQQSGHHTVQFDASHLSSGVYMYRIKAGSHTAVRKMTLMK